MGNPEEYSISGYTKATSHAIKFVLDLIERDPTQCVIFVAALKNTGFQDLAAHLESGLESPTTVSFHQNKAGKNTTFITMLKRHSVVKFYFQGSWYKTMVLSTQEQ